MAKTQLEVQVQEVGAFQTRGVHSFGRSLSQSVATFAAVIQNAPTIAWILNYHLCNHSIECPSHSLHLTPLKTGRCMKKKVSIGQYWGKQSSKRGCEWFIKFNPIGFFGGCCGGTLDQLGEWLSFRLLSFW